jgi:hypothetical protein
MLSVPLVVRAMSTRVAYGARNPLLLRLGTSQRPTV